MSKILRAIIIIIIISTPLWAGSSIFGFGPKRIGTSLYSYSAADRGRGGFSMGVFDSLTVNHLNFAAWSSLRKTAISLNVYYQGMNTESASGTSFSGDANFNGGYLAMPLIRNRLAFGFGIIPIADNDFSIQLTDLGTSAATETIKSSGKISEASVGFAYAFNEQIALSVFATYTFGNIRDETTISYEDFSFEEVTINDFFQVYGPGFGFSAMYKPLPGWSNGLTVRFPVNLELFTRQESQLEPDGVEAFREMDLPLSLRFGSAFYFSEHWFTGFDFDYQSWSSGYKIDGEKVENMNNSFRLGAGVERRPTARRFAPYTEKMTYRGGLFYGQLNTKSAGNAVSEYGLSLGLGLPIVTGQSRFDLAFELGQRGSTDSNNMSEFFYRFNIAISSTELWFQREER